MINKTFVSLYFLVDKLQVVQLSADKKKVLNIATINLPKEAISSSDAADKDISSYTVKNHSMLAKIIKSAWSKLHIRERLVGIVIPEFSTYTKLLSIPKIGLSELDEAIRWQIQEYFPTSTDNFIMDWKIAAKTDSGYQILAVLTQKEVLKGYVQSCEEAGLFPLVVVTPSLALLSQASQEDTDGKMVAYLGETESILIAAENEKIIGTAILNYPDESEIIKTARRIISHYKQLKITNFYYGGKNIGKTLAEKVSHDLQLQVHKIQPTISGLSEDSIQEYLVPIVLQSKQTAEPSDPQTVNLLPPHLVTKYRNSQAKLRLWGLTLTLTLFIWISCFSSLGAYLFLNQQITYYTNKNQSKDDVIKHRKNLVEKVKDINSVAEKVSGIQAITYYPDTIFSDVEVARPTGITLTNYKMDLDNGLIQIKGKATDRRALIEFKDKLEENSNITSVEIPISNLEVESDLTFELSYNYLPIFTTIKKGAKK